MPGACQGFCLVRPRPRDRQQGLLWLLWQVQRAWGKQNSRHFRSRSRLGCCCKKFIFTPIVANINEQSKHPCRLLSCTEDPRVPVMTLKSKWNTIFYWNRSQTPHSVSPCYCSQICHIHISQERVPLEALIHGTNWGHSYRTWQRNSGVATVTFYSQAPLCFLLS